MFEEARHLRIAGPTPVPPRVARAEARPMMAHRGPEFSALYRRVTDGLAAVFQTKGDVVVLTGSGTAAMEAAVANLVREEDTAVVVSGGKFGERWAAIAKAYGFDVRELKHPYGTGADPDALGALLQETGAPVVFATQNESSTGVLNDVQALAAVARRHGALMVVDAISGLGGANLPMDRWDVDVVVAGSQKCLMLPPGLSFVAASERAWARMEQGHAPRFYLDLPAYRRSGGKGETPYTPAVSLFFALEEALKLIEAEGLEAGFARHQMMMEMVRAGARAMHLDLFVEDRWASPTVTAIAAGEAFDADALLARARARGVTLGGGQGELKGKIVRIGHMGYAGPIDMLATLAVIELSLADLRVSKPFGQAVAAAQEVWA